MVEMSRLWIQACSWTRAYSDLSGLRRLGTDIGVGECNRFNDGQVVINLVLTLAYIHPLQQNCRYHAGAKPAVLIMLNCDMFSTACMIVANTHEAT